MTLRIIPFILLGALVFLGAHLALFYSAVGLFSITDQGVRTFLLILTAVLAVSFFLASLLTHWTDNPFTRTVYVASGFWLGLLVNLLLASAIVWVALGIAHALGGGFDPAAPAAILFVLGAAYSVYGAWNAERPRVKEVRIVIPGLPDFWKGRRIVHLSDVHLGHVHHRPFMEEVALRTNELKPDLLLITGDLFDGMDGNLKTFIEPLGKLAAPMGIYFVTGNHETYLGLDKAFAVLRQTPIQIIDGEARDLAGLQIVGVGYAPKLGKGTLQNAIEATRGFVKGKPTIFLYHVPERIPEAKAAGVHLMLSGHTHRGQLFPFALLTKLIFRGYDYGLHTEGDFSIYTSTGVGTWGPPLRTGNHPEIVVITPH